jgi:hypothetical protein
MEPKKQPSPEQKPAGETHDMFDYPHLYPSGWNLNEPPAKPKKQPMPEGYDKFPEPHTIPDGWDLG